MMGIDSPLVLLEFAENVLSGGGNTAPLSTPLGGLTPQRIAEEKLSFLTGGNQFKQIAARALKMALILLFDRGNDHVRRAEAVAEQLGYGSVPTFHTWEPRPANMDLQEMGPFHTGLEGDPDTPQGLGSYNLRRFHAVGMFYTYGCLNEEEVERRAYRGGYWGASLVSQVKYTLQRIKAYKREEELQAKALADRHAAAKAQKLEDEKGSAETPRTSQKSRE
jgi:hypothetical protein